LDQAMRAPSSGGGRSVNRDVVAVVARGDHGHHGAAFAVELHEIAVDVVLTHDGRDRSSLAGRHHRRGETEQPAAAVKARVRLRLARDVGRRAVRASPALLRRLQQHARAPHSATSVAASSIGAQVTYHVIAPSVPELTCSMVPVSRMMNGALVPLLPTAMASEARPVSTNTSPRIVSTVPMSAAVHRSFVLPAVGWCCSL